MLIVMICGENMIPAREYIDFLWHGSEKLEH